MSAYRSGKSFINYPREEDRTPERERRKNADKCRSCGRRWGAHSLTCRHAGGIYDNGDRYRDT